MLVDHPCMWSLEDRMRLIWVLNNVMREELIDRDRFLKPLIGGGNLYDSIENDSFLKNIYQHRKYQYCEGDPTKIVHFIHDVFSHYNDTRYLNERGNMVTTLSCLYYFNIFFENVTQYILNSLAFPRQQ